MTMNEKTFRIADSKVNATDMNRYFLYGGTNLLRILKNSFIYIVGLI
jgi:hypothetical protein